MYYWGKDGAIIDSSTIGSWKKTQLALADSGNYYVIVKNDVGRDSSGARITIQFAPTISTKLAAITTVNEGTSTALSVTVNADATPAPAYQWYFNGAAIANAKSSSYSKTWAAADAGSYQVTVSNAAGRDSSITNLVVNVAPAAPSLKSPADGATNQPVALTLLWGKISIAATYYVQVASDSNFATIFASDSTLTDTSKSLTGCANGATYYWRVRAKNQVGSSPWSGRRSFAVVVASAGAPVLTSPGASATGIPVTTTLTWSAVSGALTYHVQVSTASSFATTIVDDSTLSVASELVGPLTNGTQYFWRVNAKNAGGTSAWTTGNFTTVVAAPSAPNLTAPANGLTGVSVSPSLTWTATADSYHVQVATSVGFASPIVDDSLVTTGSKSVSGLSNNTKYYWRVKAKNAGGISGWSAVDSFTTIVAAPSAPTLTAPANGLTGVSVNPSLTWTANADSYHVQVATSAAFASRVVDDSLLTAASKSVTGLSTSTKYYWRVKAKNAGGTSGWSVVDSFTTIIAAPASPNLTAPANGLTGVSVSPSLAWTATADSYHVQVATSAGFASPAVDDSLLTTTTKSVTGLLNGTKYYWRVKAKNVGGTSAWSATDSFTTIVAVPAISVQPSSASANKGGTVTLKVTAAPAGVSYAWYQKGNSTIKSSTDSCHLSNLAYADSGKYYVIVSNAAGSVTSDTTAKVTVVDNVNPTITLTGGSDTVLLNSTYVDKGYSAADDRDGVVTSRVTVSGLNMAAVGKYTVTYQVSDLTGNTASVTRTVRVQGWVAQPDLDANDFTATQTANGDLFVGVMTSSPAFVAYKYTSATGTWTSSLVESNSNSTTNIKMGLSWDKTTPYFVFPDGYLTVYKYNGSSWAAASTSGPNDSAIGNFGPKDYAFKISSNGTPYLIGQKSFFTAPRYTRYNGTYWETVPSVSTLSEIAASNFVSPMSGLEMKSSGLAYYAYCSSSAGSILVEQNIGDGTGWTVVRPSIPNSSSSAFYGMILDESADPVPYVMGLDSTDGSPTVWKLGSNWVTVSGHVKQGAVKYANLAYSTFSKNFYAGYVDGDPAKTDSCYIKEYSAGSWKPFPALTKGIVPVSGSDTWAEKMFVLVGQNAYYVVYPKTGNKVGILVYNIVQ
jgi:hypothetical protein